MLATALGEDCASAGVAGEAAVAAGGCVIGEAGGTAVAAAVTDGDVGDDPAFAELAPTACSPCRTSEFNPVVWDAAEVGFWTVVCAGSCAGA